MPSASLRRRLDRVTGATRAKVRHRQGLRDHAMAARAIRIAALTAKIDPGQIRGLERLAYSHSALARLGETPETERANAEFIAHDPELARRESWAVRVADCIPRFARTPPHGRDSSLDDWYAWALAQQRRQVDPVPFRRERAPVRLSERSGHRWRRRATRKTLHAALDRLNREARSGLVSRFAIWARTLR
ncbi:MAG TPA: hypothetical protein VN808_07890 [Stellaceae bacterium]|nr:hypothetical protein [Stellaceae bacterium]